MAYTITEGCINCGRCQIECPTQAIKFIDGKFFIDAKLCNNCVDYYTVAQCAAICPTNNAINSPNTNHLGIPTTTMENYWEGWFAAYNHRINNLLHNKQQQQEENYWDKWFEVYSEKLQIATLAHAADK